MSSMKSLAKILFPILIVLLPGEVAGENAGFNLQSVHSSIKSDFKDVSHLSQAEFLALKSDGNILLFDVREKAEYEVSHIKGAYHLEPNTQTTDFLNKYQSLLNGKKVIFYCSVGVRSSQMATKLQQSLKTNGVLESFNLEGGIFGFANAGQVMQNKNGATKFVHPYNSRWGKLLKSKVIWRYKL